MAPVEYTAIKQYLDRRIAEKEREFRPTMGAEFGGDSTDRGMLWGFKEVREFVEKIETVPLGG